MAGPPPATYGSLPGPIITQPVSMGPIPATPRGLEYLALLDHVFVKQSPDIIEHITGFEAPNKYAVLNLLGQPFYAVEEEVDACILCYGGADRPFEMSVRDIATHLEVIHISRPCRCCVQEVIVSCPSAGNMPLGYVRKRVTFIAPYYEVADGQDRPVFKIEGPAFIGLMGLGYDINLTVKALDGSDAIIGNIRRQWPGIIMHAFTDADNFGISFPMDLDVKFKALLLGATILIDYTLYES